MVIGTAIAGFVFVAAAPSRSFAEIQSYDVADDGRTLILRIGLGRLSSIGYIAAEEESAAVRARVLLLHHPGTATADLLLVDVRTGLGAPLGSRSVFDQDGRLVGRRPQGTSAVAVNAQMQVLSKGAPTALLRINGIDALAVPCNGGVALRPGDGGVPPLPWDLEVVDQGTRRHLLSQRITDLPR
jgi:hypothetical protein